MNDPLNLTVQINRINKTTAVIELDGEMDVYTTPKAKETMLGLLADGYNLLVINLQKAQYLDSTALGVLVGMLKRVREQGGGLRLVAPLPRVQRLLDITRLVNVFPIDATEEEAVKNLQQKEAKS
jgi:anti-sigma B factor antagonist